MAYEREPSSTMDHRVEEGQGVRQAREVLGEDGSLTLEIDKAVAAGLGGEHEEEPSKPWSEQTDEEKRRTVIMGVLKTLALFSLLYMFLLGLDLMGNSFKVVGGKTSGNLFSFADNPVAGLMVGVFATVLVQSSSTTTSIVVALVASEGASALSVDDAIPIIMGANIGTSVTNTIVSMAHAQVPREFARAFAGATVHDFFNILCVIVLLPLETVTGLIQALTGAVTDGLVGSSGGKFKSPTKYFVAPVTQLFLEVDKKKIKKIAEGDDVEGSLIKGGMFHESGMSDTVAGIILVVISLVMLIGALVLLVKLLQSVMKGAASNFIKRALDMHPVVAMVAGAGITMAVQSSSITTSTLVPLVGINVISLEKMFPLTLGANVGTTVTALLAALASGKASGLQIALCHLTFNLLGISIWYPLPFMRAVPLNLAKQLGFSVARRRSLAIGYTVTVFVIVPLIFLGLSEAGTAALIGGGLPIFLFFAALGVYTYVRLNRPELIPASWPAWMQPGNDPEGEKLRQELAADEEARARAARGNRNKSTDLAAQDGNQA